jgi:SAM-dependent methyltransferase
VLDLGCGAGVPITQRLAEHHHVTGVDISGERLRLARQAVPGAEFVRADIGTFDPGPRRFDAVTAFYSISHTPRGTHASLFRRIASWLAPGGLFLASLGASGSADTVEEWLGVPMFFSSFDADGNRGLLRAAGSSWCATTW